MPVFALALDFEDGFVCNTLNGTPCTAFLNLVDSGIAFVGGCEEIFISRNNMERAILILPRA